ncbi:MAG: YihY/virulence factor BrkB family protein [Anaerolineaceae bacterium]|jgi:YihY family inner membrane protein|nr:MAG: YihY/virulence factor BrkB family protein [Anaerolineaceae bacterium]
MNKLDFAKLMTRLRIAYYKLNGQSHGYLRILRIVLDRLGKSQATQAAAAMAFYAFFSIFPLLLLLIGITSFWLDNDVAYQKVVLFATQLLPTAESLIEANLKQVIALRSASGSIGMVGYLWSSSSFFAVLSRNLDSAQNAPNRKFWENRVIAILIVILLTVFFGFALLSSTLVNVLPEFNVVLWNGIPLQETDIWKHFLQIVPVIASFGFFVFLYRYVPRKKVRMKSVLITSACTALGWEIASRIFSWMISLGFIRYEVIYGSLGTVLALMFWIYLICSITLIGAHLSAVLEESFTRQDVIRANRKDHARV